MCEESGGTVAVLGVEVRRRGTIGPFQGRGKHAGLKTGLELLQGETVVYIYCDAIWS